MTRKTDEKEYVKTYNEWKIYYSPTKKLYVADFEGLPISMQYLENLEELIDELESQNL